MPDLFLHETCPHVEERYKKIKSIDWVIKDINKIVAEFIFGIIEFEVNCEPKDYLFVDEENALDIKSRTHSICILVTDILSWGEWTDKLIKELNNELSEFWEKYLKEDEEVL